MTKAEINNAPTNEFDKILWEPLINFFWDRYNNRYFYPIESLQNHPDIKISCNCGFLIATIDCVLIETLEQYYSGKNKTTGKSHNPFLLFFKRSNAFNNINLNEEDACKFFGLIRSGLIHQSETKKESKINKRSTTPILGWIDEKDKNKGFKLNRDKFHKSVKDEYIKLIEEIKKPENTDLRTKFKSKLLTLVE